MAHKFKTRLISSKTGMFSDRLGVGLGEFDEFSGLAVSGRNFTVSDGDININGGDFVLNSGTAYFDSKPMIAGIPILLSGESLPISDFNNFIDELSGYFQSKIEDLEFQLSILSGS